MELADGAARRQLTRSRPLASGRSERGDGLTEVGGRGHVVGGELVIELLEPSHDDRRSCAAGDVQCVETLERCALWFVGVGACEREGRQSSPGAWGKREALISPFKTLVLTLR